MKMVEFKNKLFTKEDFKHRHNCCCIHGCEFNDGTCPVVNQQIQQSFTCDLCKDEGINSVVAANEQVNLKFVMKVD